MLDVIKIKLIVRMYYNNKSEFQIARALGISKKTVLKYLEIYRPLFDSFSSDETRNNYLINSFVRPPVYDSSSRKPTSYNEKDFEFIRTLLTKEASIKDKAKRRTKLDLFEEAQKNGFKASYSTFINIYRKIQQELDENSHN